MTAPVTPYTVPVWTLQAVFVDGPPGRYLYHEDHDAEGNLTAVDSETRLHDEYAVLPEPLQAEIVRVFERYDDGACSTAGCEHPIGMGLDDSDDQRPRDSFMPFLAVVGTDSVTGAVKAWSVCEDCSMGAVPLDTLR